MAFCPDNCIDTEELEPNLPGNCELKPRKRGIDRIGFFPCNRTLPEPMTCEGIQALIDDDVLVFSSPLAQVVVEDPQKEELEIRDCGAPMLMTVLRNITFQDRIAIQQVVASPGTSNLFYDYDFWKDKKTKQAVLRYMFIMCDGSVQVAKDDAGNYLEATLDIFISNERQGTGGTAFTLEIKKGTLSFKGDPFDFVKPETDTFGNVFNINTCNVL